MGDFVQAEPLYKRALGIDEKIFGPDNPHTATDLINLASLYEAMGQYDQAEPMVKRAVAICEKSLGPYHPHTATALNNLAKLMVGRGEFASAHDKLIRAQKIAAKLIDQVLGFTSEDQKIKFLATQRRNFEASLGLVAVHLADDKRAVRDIMDIWLGRKGAILEAQQRFQEALLYTDDPQAVTVFQELAQARSALSRLTFGGPAAEEPEVYREKIAALQAKIEELEARLSRLSQSYALSRKAGRADSKNVALALPAGSTLIEFSRIEMYDFKEQDKEKEWLPAHYLTFILPAGPGDRIILIDLGEAEPIDRAVAEFKTAVTDLSDLEGLGAGAAARRIYDLVFKPIRAQLGESKEIYISPDGNLNLIPFEVLKGPDGRFLIEDYTFNYLAAGRDVLLFGRTSEESGPPLLIGNPSFNLGQGEKLEALRQLGVEAKDKTAMAARRSSDLRGIHFAQLPGTLEEIEEIKTVLAEDHPEAHFGPQAVEELLFQRETPPKILHLATHGFFLSDPQFKALQEIKGFGRNIEVDNGLAKDAGPVTKLDNPLLRSGLALAGANNALESHDAKVSDGPVDRGGGPGPTVARDGFGSALRL